MADRLMRALLVLFAFGALAAQLPVARAQAPLADPTRPPAGVLAPDAAEVSGPVLQSVLIPKRGKPLAVIGGQQVRLGERYGDSRLVKLTEREAVLEGPDGIERLWLTPGVEKTAISSATSRSRKIPAPKAAPGDGRP